MKTAYRLLIQSRSFFGFTTSPNSNRKLHVYPPRLLGFRTVIDRTQKPFSVSGSNWGRSRVFPVTCCSSGNRNSSYVSNYSTSVETRVNDKNFERIYVHGGLNAKATSLVVERIDKDENVARDGGESRLESSEVLEDEKSVGKDEGEETAVSREDSEVEKEAWRLLKEAVVTYSGSPVGTLAANDPGDKQPLNYDQVFIRDFVPSALAFLLKGESEIVRNFLLHTLQLQSWEKTVDCYSPGQGLMPASFKIRTVP